MAERHTVFGRTYEVRLAHYPNGRCARTVYDVDPMVKLGVISFVAGKWQVDSIEGRSGCSLPKPSSSMILTLADLGRAHDQGQDKAA